METVQECRTIRDRSAACGRPERIESRTASFFANRPKHISWTSFSAQHSIVSLKDRGIFGGGLLFATASVQASSIEGRRCAFLRCSREMSATGRSVEFSFHLQPQRCNQSAIRVRSGRCAHMSNPTRSTPPFAKPSGTWSAFLP